MYTVHPTANNHACPIGPIYGYFGPFFRVFWGHFYPILGHFRPISWYLAYIPKTTPFWLVHEKGPFLGYLSINHQKRTLFHELAKKGWF